MMRTGRWQWVLFVGMALAASSAAVIEGMVGIAEAQTASTAPAVQTEVLVGSSATEMPRSKGRSAVEWANNGPEPIFCAPTSAGAVVNKARPVPAAGTWGVDSKDNVRWWCVATTPQVTGAGTIFTELR